MTSELQVLDAVVNKPFKDCLKQMYTSGSSRAAYSDPRRKNWNTQCDPSLSIDHQGMALYNTTVIMKWFKCVH